MRNFLHHSKGNVAILFAFAVVPVVGALGAAVDYSMANAYRSDMQKALDATALAISKVMPMNQASLEKVAMQYFNASMGQHDMTNLTLEVVPGQGTVRLKAIGDYNPSIAGVFGATQFKISTTSEARWGIGKVEVALVLDNSGSMGSLGRMTHLKAAAHDLLNVLQNSAVHADDAKVAIAPFDQIVNVGTANVNATWIDWTDWDAANGSYQTTTTCNGNNGKGKGQGNCNTTKTWVPDNHNTWQGCVVDRTQSNDVQDTAPTNSASTKYLATQCGNSMNNQLLTSMLPLTNNWTSLHDKIDAMTVAGYTNITIGLVWGWHLLSPTDVFTEGRAYNTEDLTKYIILMTDGDNTRNRWGSHNNFSNNMNNRTEAVCTNIKQAGIKIYTIRLIDGNANLLRGCASETSMYFDVQQASQLTAVFGTIASQIASLHLSK